ncbi:GNAT family N-acetyltransferase [Bacillus licheniformis]|uniref:GNAT family N-acetyltransferase n=1 Tax=Bacillus licheniformis TaxID=1402 RepID=UPI000E517B8A|nr:GNAT family N-acetyltransferase [Bacillus licheniformis]RHL16520.1 GNAT family N-acetyltransferase [Bacillus licheniformis]
MKKGGSIELTHYSEEHSAALLEFGLPEEQHRFTALPKEALKRTDGQFPIVILSEGEPVGFFILHATERVKDYSDNLDAMLLTALSGDRKHQGKGFAKEGMLKLPEFVSKEFTHCHEVVLVVNVKNTAAQHLYVKAGFAGTGERKTGPIGEQIVMKLNIK